MGNGAAASAWAVGKVANSRSPREFSSERTVSAAKGEGEVMERTPVKPPSMPLSNSSCTYLA